MRTNARRSAVAVAEDESSRARERASVPSFVWMVERKYTSHSEQYYKRRPRASERAFARRDEFITASSNDGEARRATRRVFAFARATSRMNHDYAITVVMAWIKPLPTLMSFFLYERPAVSTTLPDAMVTCAGMEPDSNLPTATWLRMTSFKPS